MSLGEMHTLSVLRGSSQNTFLRVCNLIPVARIIPAELKGDREWAGSHYFQVRVAHCHCSPNRTPAESWGEHECWWRLEMNDMLSYCSSPLRCPLLPETRSDRRRYRQPLCSAGSWTLCGVWAGSLWSPNPPDRSCCSPMHTPCRQEVKGEKSHKWFKWLRERELF